MSLSSKTIYLARHAKSSWDSNATTDFDRPLSDRGLRDVEKIGRFLIENAWNPSVIIASPALRAKQTCGVYCRYLDFSDDAVQWNADFYAAYTVTLLQSLTSLPETTDSVMLIGHNPSMEDLLIHLCGDATTTKHRQKNGKLFTTGNIAKISLQSTWKDLVMSDAKLLDILRPKSL